MAVANLAAWVWLPYLNFPLTARLAGNVDGLSHGPNRRIWWPRAGGGYGPRPGLCQECDIVDDGQRLCSKPTIFVRRRTAARHCPRVRQFQCYGTGSADGYDYTRTAKQRKEEAEEEEEEEEEEEAENISYCERIIYANDAPC